VNDDRDSAHVHGATQNDLRDGSDGSDGENRRGDRWPCVIQLGVGALAVATLAVVVIGAVLNTTEGI